MSRSQRKGWANVQVIRVLALPDVARHACSGEQMLHAATHTHTHTAKRHTRDVRTVKVGAQGLGGL